MIFLTNVATSCVNRLCLQGCFTGDLSLLDELCRVLLIVSYV